MPYPKLSTRIKEIKKRLALEYPQYTPLLDYQTPFQLLVAITLSAQVTDAAVNKITPQLFARWPSPEALMKAEEAELEACIYSLGFFRRKAKHLMASAQQLVQRHNGVVPQEMDALTALPGIGRKSAHAIRVHIWDLPGIIVDTHFGRVCRRLGFTEALNPEKIEKEIEALLPIEWHKNFSMTVNFHGRRYCFARKPACHLCPLDNLCPRRGLH